MGSTTFVLSVTLLGLLLRLAVVTANEPNVAIIEGTQSSAASKQVMSGKAIVIHTQLQHYDRPTLNEYQECHENLEKCKTVCEGVDDPMACVKECPVCPLLIKEEIVVQGVNDTDYRQASAKPINSTNIIRLTNQIQNIIENEHGNITLRNGNLVHIHQNISRVGGKFGLGYNNTDSCCIILAASKNCEIRKFSTAARCHRKRHRVCGGQCKSRVMLAKRITVCEQPESADEYEDVSEENCQQTVKYIPYRHSRKTHIPASKCRYAPAWPFVSCQNRPHNRVSGCGRCQRLPYVYILRNGIPPQCRRCFMAYSSPPGYGYFSYANGDDMYSPGYPAMRPMLPPIVDFDVDFENDYDFDISDGWKQEKTKCKLPNGTIVDNCQEIEGSGTDSPINIDENLSSAKNPWNDLPLPEAQDEYDDFENYDDNISQDPILRRRRQTFPRSKYSRRYKQ